MSYYNVDSVKINKQGAKVLVLGIFDEKGNKTGDYIDYVGVAVLTLKTLNAKTVHLYCNHAGNNACTKSLVHSHQTKANVVRINKQLKEE